MLMDGLHTLAFRSGLIPNIQNPGFMGLILGFSGSSYEYPRIFAWPDFTICLRCIDMFVECVATCREALHNDKTKRRILLCRVSILMLLLSSPSLRHCLLLHEVR